MASDEWKAEDVVDAAAIHASLIAENCKHPRWLERYKALVALGRPIPFATRRQLVIWGCGADLLEAGDDLCDWHDRAKNLAFTVLNSFDMRPNQSFIKPSAKRIVELLTSYPDKMRPAVFAVCPPGDSYYALSHCAFAWINSVPVLAALRDRFGVDLCSLRDSVYKFTLLHECVQQFHTATTPRVMRFLVDQVRPRRSLREFLMARNIEGFTALEWAINRAVVHGNGQDEAIRLLSSIEAGATELDWNEFPVQAYGASVMPPIQLLCDEYRDAAEAQMRAVRFARDEHVALMFRDGSHVLYPLEVVQQSEALRAELQRWQAPAAAVSAAAAAARAPALRCVSAGDTPAAAVRTYLDLQFVHKRRWPDLLNTLGIDALMEVIIFVEKFLFVGRDCVSTACSGAIRDALRPSELGERMLEGAKKAEAGDLRGEKLMGILVPMAVEHGLEAVLSSWIDLLPTSVVKAIMVGIAELAEKQKIGAAADEEDEEEEHAAAAQGGAGDMQIGGEGDDNNADENGDGLEEQEEA